MTKLRTAVSGAGMAVIAAAGWSAPPTTPPIATYWMDVTTQSGMGMSPGSQPDMGQMMAMMSGQAPSFTHMLRLRLASKTPAPAAPQAEHLIPPALQMGASLPLVTPGKSPGEVSGTAKGKLTVYWGCGDHVAAGQPMVLDLATLASGKVPESIKRWGSTMGRSPHSYGGPTDAPGFGEWPNPRDGRMVPAAGSLVGAHKIQGNYSPTIDFSLSQGQDFMGPMTLASGGNTPAGGAVVRWNNVPQATGYALAMFGANDAGETIMWSSVKTAGFANLDYLSPGDAAKAITAGDALAPSTTQCTIPAEVVEAIPMGMVMSVAYGPEVHFAEAPKNPKWAVTVRYKSSGSLMHGMEAMMGEGAPPPPPQQEQPQPRKKKGLGLGGLLGALPR
jgi:hypothetical protein